MGAMGPVGERGTMGEAAEPDFQKMLVGPQGNQMGFQYSLSF